MKALHHAAWLLLAIILQTMIFNYINIFGVHADLFLVAVIAIALLCGKIQGMLCGMVFGLICDFLIGRLVGTNMLSFAVIGYICGAIGGRYYSAPPFYVFMGIGAAATAAAEIVYLIPCTAGLEIHIPFLYALKNIVVEAVMNGVLTVPALWCIRRTIKLFGIQNINTFR